MNRSVSFRWSELFLVVLCISSSLIVFGGPQKKISPDFVSHFAVEQSGTELAVSADSLIRVERKPFSFRFYVHPYDQAKSQWHAVMIAATINKHQLDELKTGVRLDDTHFFAGGMGMAPHTDGFYKTLFIQDEYCHYLYYASEADRRVNLLSKQKDWLRVEFPVKGLDFNDNTISLAQFKYSEIHIAALYNVNMNETIDAGELICFTLKLI